jgi:Tfp pilus assembly protein PilN
VINLIPKEEKEKNAKIFYYRLLVLFLFMLGLSIFIGSISLLPAYFISNTKYLAVNQKLEAQKNEPLPSLSEETLLKVKALNFKLELIEKTQHNQFVVSQRIINAITSNKMPDIKITHISYENDPVKGKKVNIEGTAPSREALLSFRLALEGDKSFKQVDLPISNFVKGSNIQFSLSLIPSQ